MSFFPRWHKIVAKAEKCFQYMLHHNMIQEDRMEHFLIYHANRKAYPYAPEFDETYRADVERLMIPWIREEEQSGRLQDRTQWRPFRTGLEYEKTLMGYHRLFVYYPTRLPTGDRSYRASFGPSEVPDVNGRTPRMVRAYFMLGIAEECFHLRPMECVTCSKDLQSGLTPTFIAALYGWEEDDMPYLKPHAHFVEYNRCEHEQVDAELPLVPSICWDEPENDDASWGYIDTTPSDTDSDSSV